MEQTEQFKATGAFNNSNIPKEPDKHYFIH